MTERRREAEELLEDALAEFRSAPAGGAPPEILVSLLEAQAAAARRRAFPRWVAAAALLLAVLTGFWAGRSSAVWSSGDARRPGTEAQATVPAALPAPPRIPFVSA